MLKRKTTKNTRNKTKKSKTKQPKGPAKGDDDNVEEITSLALSLDGSYIVSGSQDTISISHTKIEQSFVTSLINPLFSYKLSKTMSCFPAPSLFEDMSQVRGGDELVVPLHVVLLKSLKPWLHRYELWSHIALTALLRLLQRGHPLLQPLILCAQHRNLGLAHRVVGGCRWGAG